MPNTLEDVLNQMPAKRREEIKIRTKQIVEDFKNNREDMVRLVYEGQLALREDISIYHYSDQAAFLDGLDRLSEFIVQKLLPDIENIVDGDTIMSEMKCEELTFLHEDDTIETVMARFAPYLS